MDNRMDGDPRGLTSVVNSPKAGASAGVRYGLQRRHVVWTIASLLISSAAQQIFATEPPRLDASSASELPTPTPRQATLEPFWAKRITGYLNARDGVRLRYSVLLPPGAGPFPVAMTYSGYDAGSIGGPAYLHGLASMDPAVDKSLVEAGYAVFGVNARATGCSEGDSFDSWGPIYGQDGYDAVEFAAAQSWSTGAVGMHNWSWAGISQLWTASFRPPHLKAIAPGMVVADVRADSYAPGGVSQPAMISGWPNFILERWQGVRESATAEKDTECLAHLEHNIKLERKNSTALAILQHPVRDAWVDERTVALRTHLISVPILSMTAYQDEATTSRDGYFQDTIDPRRLWIVETNGGHEIYASEAYRPILIAFYDRFVKGRQNGWDNGPHLRIWQEATSSRPHDPLPFNTQESAAPSWTIELPSVAPETHPVVFNLSTGGQMLQEQLPGAPETFAYPLPGPAISADSWGASPQGWRGGSLAFTSAPLTKNLVAFGSGSADLWLSAADSTDADIQVTLSVVRPDGQEMYVQRGWLRLSDRALDDGRSTVTRPVLLDRPEFFQPLEFNQPVLARIELMRFSFAFRKGDRIRLWIDTPSTTGLYTFSYNSVPAKLTLYHDHAHISRLVLPELPNITVPPAAQKCGTVLGQPCRQDPLAEAPQ